MENSHKEKLYIKEVAERLNRREATIRGWERKRILPINLVPLRDEKGWRYWTPKMVQDTIDWMKIEDLRPGKGLPHYNPTPQQLMNHILNQRKND
jgi:DNA-binding transcriptional MerR regulator